MPPISKEQILGGLADFAVAELEANKDQAIALIASAEGSVENALAKVLKNAPKPAGLAGTVFPILEGAIEKYAANLVATYGPSVIFSFIDGDLHAWATSLGG